MKDKFPSKTNINLVQKESKQGEKTTLIVGLVLIALLSLAVAKFGVIDQYARLFKAEGKYREVHENVNKLNDSMKDYDEVLSEYQIYSVDWLKNNPKTNYVNIDRRQILNILEREVLYKGDVTNISISKNTVVINMSGLSLKEISNMSKALEAYDDIEYCGLQYAETSNNNEDMEFALTLYLSKGEE